MKIFYNTSTGNSLYVAKIIEDNFEGCELISISKVLKENMNNINYYRII